MPRKRAYQAQEAAEVENPPTPGQPLGIGFRFSLNRDLLDNNARGRGCRRRSQ